MDARLVPSQGAGLVEGIVKLGAEPRVLELGSMSVPVLLRNREPGASFASSPYVHYVTCAWEETRSLKSLGLSLALGPILGALGLALRMGAIDRIALINGSGFATDLPRGLSREEIRAALRTLLLACPDRAFVVRSLWKGPEGTAAFEGWTGAGFRPLVSRYVWLFDARDPVALRSSLLRRDGKALARAGYEIAGPESIEDHELPRLRALYESLYIEKYSLHNPVYHEDFFRAARDGGGLELRVLRKGGRIDGVVGFYVRGQVMTAPVFGYDASLPQKLGLYRMLSWICVDEARRRSLLLHQSAGAAGFKRLRRARGFLEYWAVYDQHLPLRRRMTWRLLAALANRLGGPMLGRGYEKLRPWRRPAS